MIRSRRTGLALPRQSDRMATRVGSPIFPCIGTLVRHPGHLFGPPWLEFAIRYSVLPAQSYPHPSSIRESTHIGGRSASGLVQSIFSSPARRRGLAASLEVYRAAPP